jgi:hypothetical protein
MFKTIFLTVCATLAISGFVAYIFLHTILGAFGLATASIAAMNGLQASERIVQQMKERHKYKKSIWQSNL